MKKKTNPNPKPKPKPKSTSTSKRPARKNGKRSTSNAKSASVPSLLLKKESPPSRTAVHPEKPAPEPIQPAVDSGSLPEAYGTGKLLLTARDPHWLYAYWDLTREQQQTYNRRSASGHLVLRIHIHAQGANQPHREIELHPDSRNWFVNVEAANTTFVGELGFYASDDDWNSIATSTAVTTPPDDAHRHPGPGDPVRHPFQPQEVVPAGSSGLSAGPQSSGAVSSFSRPGQESTEQSFWFNINAELVVYGATEPDASVFIAGRPVQLRPDGSFSFRFSLPDGEYHLPAEAVSADGTERRRVELSFKRSTRREGTDNAPQKDPSLKPPPKNAAG